MVEELKDEAVLKATGKGWDDWFKLLDAASADKMEHGAIVRLLHDGGLIESSWWCQMVTNTYEKARGKRELGSTTTGAFQFGIQKTFPFSVSKAWEFVTSPRATAVWLGTEVEVKTGQAYQSSDGIKGEIRVVNPGVNFRLSWQPNDWPKHSIIQVRTLPSGRGSVIGFHHENLPSAEARAEMKQRWTAVMAELEALI